MDIHSQLVAYRCCIPVWIIQILRILAIKYVFGNCYMDVLFLSSRGLLVRGKRRSRSRLITIVTQDMPVSMASDQPRNQLLDMSLIPDDIWRSWS